MKRKSKSKPPPKSFTQFAPPLPDEVAVARDLKPLACACDVSNPLGMDEGRQISPIKKYWRQSRVVGKRS